MKAISQVKITKEAQRVVKKYCKKRGLFVTPAYSSAILIGIKELIKKDEFEHAEQKQQGA